MVKEQEKLKLSGAGGVRLEILGCGTSTGVPLPACRCAVCRSGLPRNQRLRPSALLSADGSQILIDAGPDLRAQALRSGIEHLDAVLFTHAHADHIFGVDDLRCFNFVRPGTIPCYGAQDTLAQVRHIFTYIFDPEPDYQGGAVARLELRPVRELEEFMIGQALIQSFPLWHGRTRVLGFRCGGIAYVTDCSAIPEETIRALQHVRFLVLDGLRFEPHRTHFSIPEAIKAAELIGAEKTYLTHLTHSVDYDTVQRQLPAGIELAYDGLVIEDHTVAVGV